MLIKACLYKLADNKYSSSVADTASFSLLEQGSAKVACQRSDTASRAEALRPLHSRLSCACGLGELRSPKPHAHASVAAPQAQSH